MARKRIAELVKEEVTKVTPTPGETVIDVKAEKIQETEKLAPEPSTEKITDTRLVDELEATIKHLKASLEQAQEKETNQKQKNLDLEANIKELRAELEKAQQQNLDLEANFNESKEIQQNLREKGQDLDKTVKKLTNLLSKTQENEEKLQQHNSDLQSELTEQKTLVERLSRELNDAKKAALSLAETNTQIIDEINSIKVQKTQQEKPQEEKPKQEKYNPLAYRKSHRSIEKRYQAPIVPSQPVQQSSPDEDTSQSQMWLLD
ncbi:MAG: hypothetical protein KME64_14875 [Scytonematopsis contorta HA4267-MV1]|jgi:chromosome segregation ATPase|nr:hypothetical protein [Scytonematopsis contorta HA4267-MV1]